MPIRPFSVEGDAIVPDDEPSPSRAVMVGRVDLSEVPGFVLRFGVARVDTGVHLTEKDPDKFRLPGKTGPGHVDHPLTRQAGRDGREAEIVVAKMRRELRLREVTIKRKGNSKEQKILQLSEEYQHLGRNAATTVAELMGVTADYVRRVVKKNKPA